MLYWTNCNIINIIVTEMVADIGIKFSGRYFFSQ